MSWAALYLLLATIATVGSASVFDTTHFSEVAVDVEQGAGGLFNQHYTALSAFTVALTIRAQYVQFWNSVKERESGMAAPFVFGNLSRRYELEQVHKYFAVHNLTLSYSDIKTRWPKETVCHVKLPGSFCRSYSNFQATFSSLLQSATNSHCKNVSEPRRLILTVEGARYALQLRTFPRARDAVYGLTTFSKPVANVAQQAKAALARVSQKPSFNGAHLRVEGDSATWFHADKYFTHRVYWPMYFDAASAPSWNTSLPLYVATGLTLEEKKIHKKYVDKFCQRYSSGCYMLSDLVPADVLTKFSMEQRAIMDFLVLTDATQVIGSYVSTFSWFLQAYRHLIGANWESTSLVGKGNFLIDMMSAFQGPDIAYEMTQCYQF